MRNRPIRFELCFNEDEYTLLNAFSDKMNISKAQVIRFLLKTAVLVEAPAIDYRKWIFLRGFPVVGAHLGRICCL